MGNIVLKEIASAPDSTGNTVDPDRTMRVIRISQQLAYQRIVNAIQKQVALLEKQYAHSYDEACHWLKQSYIIAILEVMIITISVNILVFLFLLHMYSELAYSAVVIGLFNTADTYFTCWIFSHMEQANKQVNAYLKNLTEIRSFAKIIQFTSDMHADPDPRSILQRTIVFTALGLSEQDIKDTPTARQRALALKDS